PAGSPGGVGDEPRAARVAVGGGVRALGMAQLPGSLGATAEWLSREGLLSASDQRWPCLLCGPSRKCRGYDEGREPISPFRLIPGDESESAWGSARLALRSARRAQSVNL